MPYQAIRAFKECEPPHLVKLTRIALEMDDYDFTNRVTTSWVIVAFDTATKAFSRGLAD
jgi:hypothetical protein